MMALSRSFLRQLEHDKKHKGQQEITEFTELSILEEDDQDGDGFTILEDR